MRTHDLDNSRFRSRLQPGGNDVSRVSKILADPHYLACSDHEATAGCAGLSD